MCSHVSGKEATNCLTPGPLLFPPHILLHLRVKVALLRYVRRSPSLSISPANVGIQNSELIEWVKIEDKE